MYLLNCTFCFLSSQISGNRIFISHVETLPCLICGINFSCIWQTQKHISRKLSLSIWRFQQRMLHFGDSECTASKLYIIQWYLTRFTIDRNLGWHKKSKRPHTVPSRNCIPMWVAVNTSDSPWLCSKMWHTKSCSANTFQQVFEFVPLPEFYAKFAENNAPCEYYHLTVSQISWTLPLPH